MPLGGGLKAIRDHLALAGLKPSWAESPIDLATFPPIAGKSPGERANHPKSPHLSTIPRLPTPPKPVTDHFNPPKIPLKSASPHQWKKNEAYINTKYYEQFWPSIQYKLRLECESIPFPPMQHFELHRTSNSLTSTNQEKHFYFWLGWTKMLVARFFAQINSSIQVVELRPTSGSNNCFKPVTINGCRH